MLGLATSNVTVTALEDLDLLVLEGEQSQALIDQTARAAREIGRFLEARRKAVRKARVEVRGRLPIGRGVVQGV